MARLYDEAQGNNLLIKGIVLDIDSLLTGHSDRGMTELISYQMHLPEVKAFLEDKTQKFDLISLEAIANYHLILPTFIIYIIVLIYQYFQSSGNMVFFILRVSEHYHSMGALAWHPTLYPYFYRQKYANLTL